MIANMGVEIEGVEYLTTAEAVELAREMGRPVTRQGVTGAARSEKIEGAVKPGKSTTGWLIPKDSFTTWLRERLPRGPKSD